MKNKGSLSEKPVADDAGGCLYKLEIVLLPGKGFLSTRDSDGEYSFQPYDIPDFTPDRNSRIILWPVHAKDLERVQRLRVQLLAIGVAERVTIIKLPK